MKRQTGSGWVPRVAMDAVAARLGMAPIRVYEVATFYFMFNTTPVGRFHLQVCTTTPCWLRGSDAIEAACRKVTGIKGWGETSADGMFSMTQGRVPGRLRECADPAGGRRFLRGHGRPGGRGAAGGPGARRAAEARQRDRTADLGTRRRPTTLLSVTE